MVLFIAGCMNNSEGITKVGEASSQYTIRIQQESLDSIQEENPAFFSSIMPNLTHLEHNSPQNSSDYLSLSYSDQDFILHSSHSEDLSLNKLWSTKHFCPQYCNSSRCWNYGYTRPTYTAAYSHFVTMFTVYGASSGTFRTGRCPE
jgi:hypothetical protein